MHWIEAFAVVFGLASVALTVKQSIWCWPTGLAQVTLYVFVFYTARLYSDMLLHVVYIALQIYGWHHWLRGSDPARIGNLPVTRLSPFRLGMLIAVTALAAFIWGELMSRYTDAAVAHADAFIAAASLTAQYLLARKKLETWFFWIVVDVVAIAVYWSRDLVMTAGLYTVFLALCVLGLREWRGSHRRSVEQRKLAPGTPA